MFHSFSNPIISRVAVTDRFSSIRIAFIAMAVLLLIPAGPVFADGECPYDENGIPRCGESVTVPGLMPTPTPWMSPRPDFGGLPDLGWERADPQPEPTPEPPTTPEVPIERAQCVKMTSELKAENEKSLKKAVETLVTHVSSMPECEKHLSPQLDQNRNVSADHVWVGVLAALDVLLREDKFRFEYDPSKVYPGWAMFQPALSAIPESWRSSPSLQSWNNEIVINPYTWSVMTDAERAGVLAEELAHAAQHLYAGFTWFNRHCTEMFPEYSDEECDQFANDLRNGIVSKCAFSFDIEALPIVEPCKE